MSEKAEKIVYKAENNKEFFVIANPGEAKQWRADKTKPLIDVVQSFDIFTTSAGGNVGEAIRPASGELESAFGPMKADDIVKTIVEHGVIKSM